MKSHWIIGLLFVSITGFAQNVDLSSPRASYKTFYDNLADAENPDVRSASRVIYTQHVLSRKKRIDLIGKLKTYLDTSNIVLFADSIPDNTNYFDSLTNEYEYVIVKGITLKKIGKSWYLSKATVSLIPKLVVSMEVAEEVEVPKQPDRRFNVQKQYEAELEQIARMPVDLSSPYAVVKFYSDNIASSPETASRVISNNAIPNMDKRIEIVEKLNRFLEGKGVYIDLDKVPDDPDYADSTKTNVHRFEISYRFSEIYLEKEGKQWYLSKESAEIIPALYDTAFPFGSDRFLKYLPKEGRREIFGLYSWQYIAILIIVVLVYLVFRLLNWSISWLVTRVLFRFGYKEVAKKYVPPIVKPIGILIAFILAEMTTPFLQLPVKATAFIAVTVEVLIPLFATISIYQAVKLLGLYLEKVASKTDSPFDDQLAPIITKILRTFVIIVGAIYVLKNLNVDLAILFGTLSVGGLAMALAAQDTIKNFFGSLMIFVDKPFLAGHWITTTDGLDGTVEEVGFRSTRIRTFENSLITVPNGKLSDAAINNYGLRAYRRFKTHIAVTYDTPPDVLDLFIKGLREIVLKHPHTRKDYYHVYMNDMGAHSLDILFYIFFITPNWADELKYRHEVILSIIRLAKELGINFAFPTQTLHMENFPGQMSLSPTYETVDKLEMKMDNFFNEQLKTENKKNKE